MGVAVWSLLLCGFFGGIFWVLAECYCLGICDGVYHCQNIYRCFMGTVNCTMPNSDKVGYDNRMSGLVKSSKT